MMQHKSTKRKNEDYKFSPIDKLYITLNYYINSLDYINIYYGWFWDEEKIRMKFEDSKFKVDISIKINPYINDANDVIEYIKYVYKFKLNIDLDEEIALAKRPTFKEMKYELYGKPFWKFW